MLLDLFLKLLKNLKLRDEWVLGLADISLGSFFVDGLGKVQLISLKIISWVSSMQITTDYIGICQVQGA
jgi:hypothetical protein